MWASWSFLGLPWLTTLLTVIIFGLWGGLMYYFIGQMPGLGEISVTNWFLIRVIPTTVVALAAGGSLVWSAWVYTQNLAIPALIALVLIIVWGGFMYYFISHLPE